MAELWHFSPLFYPSNNLREPNSILYPLRIAFCHRNVVHVEQARRTTLVPHRRLNLARDLHFSEYATTQVSGISPVGGQREKAILVVHVFDEQRGDGILQAVGDHSWTNRAPLLSKQAE